MPAKEKSKRKGLGGLSPEKKKLLKQLILQKAAEDMKKKQEEEALEKKRIIEARIPKLDIDGLGQADLEKRVKHLYQLVCRLEEEKYEWETKIRRQDAEISGLTMKLNDAKGKFSKPMLKKVAKVDAKMAKFEKEKRATNFRESLKSTGPKFTIEEEEKSDKPEWSIDQLKHKNSENGDGDEKEEDANEEEEAEESEEEEE